MLNGRQFLLKLIINPLGFRNELECGTDLAWIQPLPGPISLEA
jgi:hypothetical protein